MFSRRALALGSSSAVFGIIFVPPLACSVPFRVGQILFCNVYFDGVVVFLVRIQLYYYTLDFIIIYISKSKEYCRIRHDLYISDAYFGKVDLSPMRIGIT